MQSSGSCYSEGAFGCFYKHCLDGTDPRTRRLRYAQKRSRRDHCRPWLADAKYFKRSLVLVSEGMTSDVSISVHGLVCPVHLFLYSH